MLIFNTTYHLENKISDACLTFFKEVYIPQALESGILTDPALSKVHANHGESGVTYALQFKAESIEDLNEWASLIGESLKEKLVRKFGNKVAGFVTLLEEVAL